MFKRFSCFLLILTCFLISGYGEEVEPPVKFASAPPPSGSIIDPDTVITVTFSSDPGNVTVTAGRILINGKTATISGPFPLGSLDLNLAWADGVQGLTYTVKKAEPSPSEGMVLIPAGEFQMGSDDNEAANDEHPVHTVSVDAFYMDVHEVTNLEYKEFVLANPRWQKDRIDRAFHNGDYLKHWNGNEYPRGKANHPVVNVSWYAAMAYALSKDKRLPTEAEWEYAARGGLAGNKYPNGNVIGAANYRGIAGDTTAVGKYPANGYGLFDMAGNVWEWCLDEYNANFYFESPRENPLSGANTVDWFIKNFTNVKNPRVSRGGSWGNDPGFLRVAKRLSPLPTFASTVFGFRCARAQ